MADLERIRRRADFQSVYKRGVKVAGRYVVVFALARDERGCRVGITATRRTGNAVVRNRARRRVRELFRHSRETLATFDADIVVNIRIGCADAAWRELEEDYLRCVGTVKRRLSARAS